MVRPKERSLYSSNIFLVKSRKHNAKESLVPGCVICSGIPWFDVIAIIVSVWVKIGYRILRLLSLEYSGIGIDVIPLLFVWICISYSISFPFLNQNKLNDVFQPPGTHFEVTSQTFPVEPNEGRFLRADCWTLEQVPSFRCWIAL